MSYLEILGYILVTSMTICIGSLFLGLSWKIIKLAVFNED